MTGQIIKCPYQRIGASGLSLSSTKTIIMELNDGITETWIRAPEWAHEHWLTILPTHKSWDKGPRWLVIVLQLLLCVVSWPVPQTARNQHHQSSCVIKQTSEITSKSIQGVWCVQKLCFALFATLLNIFRLKYQIAELIIWEVIKLNHGNRSEQFIDKDWARNSLDLLNWILTHF